MPEHNNDNCGPWPLLAKDLTDSREVSRNRGGWKPRDAGLKRFFYSEPSTHDGTCSLELSLSRSFEGCAVVTGAPQ